MLDEIFGEFDPNNPGLFGNAEFSDEDDEDEDVDLFDDEDENDGLDFSFDDDEDDEDDVPFDPTPRASWPNVGASRNTRSCQPPAYQAPQVSSGGTWPNVGAQASAPVPGFCGTGAPQVSSQGPAVATLVKPKAVLPKTPKVRKPKVAKAAKTKKSVARIVVSRDNRNRACVPVDFSEEVGFKRLSQVFVSKRAGGGGLMLLKKPTKSGHLSTYKTDRDGNIRLSNYILGMGGITSASVKFRVTDNKTGIVVLPA
jgi:hypothetical protein